MLDLAARSWRTEAWILQQIKAGHSQYAKCGVTSGHEENRVRLDGLSATMATVHDAVLLGRLHFGLGPARHSFDGPSFAAASFV
jgi:hypothetical protein